MNIRQAILLFFIIILSVGAIFVASNRKSLSLLYTLASDSNQKNYLVLFQNNLELRPSGGYIGNFAILKVKSGKLQSYEVFNTNEFDLNKSGIDSPQPFKDLLAINKLQMRDSNWSPDFKESAQIAQKMYTLEGGKEKLDGVVGVDASILPILLGYTGKVYVDSASEPFTKDNVLLTLQYETTFGYKDQGLSRSQRKAAVVQLLDVIKRKMTELTIVQKVQLLVDMNGLVQQKHIMLYLNDSKLQQIAQEVDYTGQVKPYDYDYFYLIDANLGALKTDYYMKRSIIKKVDECADDKTKLCSKVYITYFNSAANASPLNNDYRSYSRIYVPKEAFIQNIEQIDSEKADYFTEFDRKGIGFVVKVPFNSKKTIILSYTQPKNDKKDYSFLIQKQPGVDSIDVDIKYKGQELNGLQLKQDKLISF